MYSIWDINKSVPHILVVLIVASLTDQKQPAVAGCFCCFYYFLLPKS